MNTVDTLCDVVVVAVLVVVFSFGLFVLFMLVAPMAGEYVGFAVAVAVLVGFWIQLQKWK